MLPRHATAHHASEDHAAFFARMLRKRPRSADDLSDSESDVCRRDDAFDGAWASCTDADAIFGLGGRVCVSSSPNLEPREGSPPAAEHSTPERDGEDASETRYVASDTTNVQPPGLESEAPMLALDQPVAEIKELDVHDCGLSEKLDVAIACSSFEDAPPVRPSKGKVDFSVFGRDQRSTKWDPVSPSISDEETPDAVADPADVACSAGAQVLDSNSGPAVTARAVPLATSWGAVSSDGDESDTPDLASAAPSEQQLELDGDVPVKQEPPLALPMTREPVIAAGTERWLKPLLATLDRAFKHAGQPTRTYITHNLYFRGGAHLMPLRLLGIPFQTIATSDNKQTGRDCCKRVFGDCVTYCFTTGDEAAAITGFDRLTSASVRIAHPVQPHCSSTWFPGFHPNHTNNGNGCRAYDQACTEWFAHLKQFRPLTLWVEQEPSYKTARDQDGKYVLESFLESCRSLGYYMIHFLCPHETFLKGIARTSLIVAGFSKEAGGLAAMQRFKNIVQPALIVHQKMGPCAQPWNRRSGACPGAVACLLENDCDTDSFELSDPGSVAALIMRCT